jgi:hypothetical protein
MLMPVSSRFNEAAALRPRKTGMPSNVSTIANTSHLCERYVQSVAVDDFVHAASIHNVKQLLDDQTFFRLRALTGSTPPSQRSHALGTIVNS